MNIVREISLNTGMSASDVLNVIATAPARYKQYPILKRSGGTRIIAQPSRELKTIQRFFMDHWLGALRVHPAAMAYVEGRNIKDNAEAHRKRSALLKLDFQEFFPSIKVTDWVAYIRRHMPEWNNAADIRLTSRVLFWGQGTPDPKCLSIGAPTSPIISNLIMYELDELFAAEAGRRALAYTRYADDITISGASINEIVALEKFIRSTLTKWKSPKLKINEKKRGIYTKGQRRMVTGLIVTPEGKVSIGRDRKRLISSLLHKFSLNQLGLDDIGYLKGMLGFTIANEPMFVNRMREKYGNEVVNRVLSIHIPRREENDVG
jgi:retron-type reverse transcriptase